MTKITVGTTLRPPLPDSVDLPGDLENRSRSLNVELIKGLGEMHHVYKFEDYRFICFKVRASTRVMDGRTDGRTHART